jgi:hypothetical protein
MFESVADAPLDTHERAAERGFPSALSIHPVPANAPPLDPPVVDVPGLALDAVPEGIRQLDAKGG